MKESFSGKLVRSRLNLAGRTERERLTKTAHALRVRLRDCIKRDLDWEGIGERERGIGDGDELWIWL